MAEREFRDEVGGIFRSYDDDDRDTTVIASITPVDDRNRGDELRVALNVLVFVRRSEGVRAALANAHRMILEGAERGFRSIGEMSEKFGNEREI
jgi:hypothetical protein